MRSLTIGFGKIDSILHFALLHERQIILRQKVWRRENLQQQSKEYMTWPKWYAVGTTCTDPKVSRCTTVFCVRKGFQSSSLKEPKTAFPGRLRAIQNSFTIVDKSLGK